MILSCICISSAFVIAEEPELTFGRKWVRSHPFTICGLLMRPNPNAKPGVPEADFDLEKYLNCNMNTMMVWKARESILKAAVESNTPVIMRNQIAKRSSYEDATAWAEKYGAMVPSITGWMLWDEPVTEDLPRVRRLVDWTRKKFPGKLIFSNLNKVKGMTFLQHVHNSTKVIKPDILMYDLYPFGNRGTHNYFPDLSAVRQVGLEQGLPYWAWIQSYGRRERYPSESELRMHVYTHLAAGYTGIAYYTYDYEQTPAMVDLQNNLQPLYYYAQKLNREVANLGQVLKLLTSTDVRYITSSRGVLAEGLLRWARGAGDEMRIKDIIIEPGKVLKEALIGFFRDDDKASYFMIVNLNHGPGLSAQTAAKKISLVVEPESVLYRINRFTGKTEPVKLKDGVLDLTLPGGTGALFKFGDSKNPAEEHACVKYYRAAYEPVTDDPNLPRVLLIGDSVSEGYTVFVRDLLKGKANVHRIPINGRETTAGLKNLDQWLGDKPWDVIHFNFGLHDLRYDDYEKRIQTTPLNMYNKNLRAIVRKLKKTDAHLVWASTTPVQNARSTSNYGARLNADVIRYNNLAGTIMKQNNIAIDDLYEAAISAAPLSKLQYDSVHFNAQGCRILARSVAEHIETALDKR